MRSHVDILAGAITPQVVCAVTADQRVVFASADQLVVTLASVQVIRAMERDIELVRTRVVAPELVAIVAAD